MTTLVIQNIIELVRQSRQRVAVAVNAEVTLLYWQVGSHIKQDILNNSRAEYGRQVMEGLAASLHREFGKGWSVRHLWNCLKVAEVFNDIQIVHTLCTQLSWSHFRLLCSIEDETKREFYTALAKTGRWSVRELDAKIDAMLYERTAIAAQPGNVIKQEISKLQNNEILAPDLVFKNTYVLDFLGLSGDYSENDLENAILHHIERFIMEMGNGFAFIERQKRISVDDTDYHLDLLFYHRKLQSLIAVDLKLGKFKPGYKGQMELYLRWLERYDMQPGENPPIGLILCSEGNTEHIELLMLHPSDIRVAQYLTELPPKEWFIDKLHRAVEIANNRDKQE